MFKFAREALNAVTVSDEIAGSLKTVLPGDRQATLAQWVAGRNEGCLISARGHLSNKVSVTGVLKAAAPMMEGMTHAR